MRLVASHEATGYPDGAPPGFSGGFREDSCHACHFHEKLNGGPGTLTVDGVPPSITPGRRYTLTIRLTGDAMKRAGFQLSARFKNKGTQAGNLTINSSDARRVKLESQNGVLYASQNRTGSEMTERGVTQWSVDWIAPVGSGEVIFNIAANAADGDDRVDGDFVYTTVLEGVLSPPE